jgi:hypothetical protein
MLVTIQHPRFVWQRHPKKVTNCQDDTGSGDGEYRKRRPHLKIAISSSRSGRLFEFTHLQREVALIAQFFDLVKLGFQPIHMVFFVLKQNH